MQITITLISKELDLMLSDMLERRKPLDLMFPLKGGASKEVGGRKESITAADRLRAAVNLTADAVKAVSLTAMEALREGAAFIGIVGEQDELIDPFHHLDGPSHASFVVQVEGFERYTMERAMRTISQTTEFKTNCCVVIIDFFVRHGFVAPEEPGYAELVKSLRS